MNKLFSKLSRFASHRRKMLQMAVAYPKMPQYPQESDDLDDDLNWAAHKRWDVARSILKDQPEGYTDGFDTFFSNSVRVFLSGAEMDNIVYSPLSLYMALGIAAEISAGNTRKQILDALSHEDIDTLRSHSRSVWLANYLDDGMAKCILATSLWLNDAIDYNEDTLGILGDNYFSSVFGGDPADDEFNKLMQSWMKEQTDDLLDDMVSSINMLPDMLLTLASVVNYSGKWHDEFSEELTKQGTFHSPDGDIHCDFMHYKRSNFYYWGENFSAVEMDLDYNGAMRLILPNEGVSAEKLINDVEAVGYMISSDGYPNWKKVIVDLSVPKFDVSSHIDLKDGLAKLGITDLFDPERSDLSPLSKKAKENTTLISTVTQDTRVMIDEEGCRATSLTVSGWGTGLPPKDEIRLVFDRPFIFEIMSDAGLPLFIGIVNDPVG